MLCRCMTIRQQHEAPYQGKLSLEWKREDRPKMRVVLWTYPKGGMADNLPSGSGKSRQGGMVVLWRARERGLMKSNDSRRAFEVCSLCKSERPILPGANDEKRWWIT